MSNSCALPLPFASGDVLRFLTDVELEMEFPIAVCAVVLLLLVLPAGRRRLVTLPAILLVLAGLALLLPQVLQGSSRAGVESHALARFLLLASLLVSVLRIGAVGVWERIARPVSQIVLDVVGWLLVGVALVATLYDAGMAAGDLFTGSAVFTAVLGFALKDTLGNVFAGLAIHAEQPFQVGDWIQYDTDEMHVGRVVEINWRATKLLTPDAAHLVIPNGKLAEASIRNFTKPQDWSRRSLRVVTSYDVSPQRVHAIILEAVRGSFGVLEDPEPSVITSDFTELGVEHTVRLFTSEFDQRGRVDGEARDRIWYALARQGIAIPVTSDLDHHASLLGPVLPAATAEQRVAFLEKIRLLEPLGKEIVRRLAESSIDHLHAAGEQIVRQGDAGTSMFVIMSGRVEVTARRSPSDPVARLAVIEAGDHFGEMSLMTGAPRTATVTALEETRLLEIGKEAFAGILTAQPELVEALGRSLQERNENRSHVIAVTGRSGPGSQDILARIRDFFRL